MNTKRYATARQLMATSWLMGMSVLLTSNAQAQLCTYQAYAPTSVYQYVHSTFLQMGIVPVNARLFNSERSDHALVRGDRLLGYVNFKVDQRKGQTVLEFFDPAGKMLASQVELVYPCPTRNPIARCYDTRLSTELDRSVFQKDAPFRILDGHLGVEYYRYGNERHPILWRGEFDDALDWIFSVYQYEVEPLAIRIPDAFSAFEFAVMNHPAIQAAAELIRVHRIGSKVVVTGVVPSNYVYDQIVSVAMGFGIYQIDMRVTIDTRLRGPGPLLPPLRDCL